MTVQVAPASLTIRVRTLLAATIVALVLGHLAFVAALDLGGTDVLWPLSLSSDLGVGTWVSALLLAAAALLALGCGAVARRPRRRGFRVLAAALTLVSVDEVAAQHERVGRELRDSFDLGGFLYYAWVLPAAALVFGFVAWQWRWFVALEAPLRRPLALAAVLFLGGAMGIELLESRLASDGGEASLAYLLLVAVEEALELAAASIVVLALHRHLVREAPRWEVRLAPGILAIGPGGPAGGPEMGSQGPSA